MRRDEWPRPIRPDEAILRIRETWTINNGPGQTLQMQHDAVIAATSAGLIDRYWAAGAAPVFEIIAEYDPFHPRDQWGDLRSGLGSRVTTTVIDGAGHALFPKQPGAVLPRHWSSSQVPGEDGKLRDSAIFSVTAAGWRSAKLSLGKRVARPANRDLDLNQKAPGGSKAVAAKFGPLGP